MAQRATDIIVQLISSLQGAPYPGTIDNELYTIWYEHAQIAAQEALEYLEKKQKKPKDELDDLVEKAKKL
jgi:hypothetical protein